MRTLLVCLFVAGVLMAWYFSASLLEDFETVGVQAEASPDDRFVLDHCQSRTDTQRQDHAPYGDHVYLRYPESPSCTGDIVFAGYCAGLKLQWNNSSTVDIHCAGEERIVTLASLVRGITVRLERTEPAPPEQ